MPLQPAATLADSALAGSKNRVEDNRPNPPAPVHVHSPAEGDGTAHMPNEYMRSIAWFSSIASQVASFRNYEGFQQESKQLQKTPQEFGFGQLQGLRFKTCCSGFTHENDDF